MEVLFVVHPPPFKFLDIRLTADIVQINVKNYIKAHFGVESEKKKVIIFKEHVQNSSTV